MIVEVLAATEEGPNTFWARTNWKNIETPQRNYPEHIYRTNENIVEWLVGLEEGPNTYWKFFDFGSIKNISKVSDPRIVLREVIKP